jgi:hypothetical protein
MERVRVYALSDPTAAAREITGVTRAVLAALGVSDPSRHEVSIGASSGWLSYRMRGELWDRQFPPTLPSAEEAKRQAEQVLGKLTVACSSANPYWPKALDRIMLFPRRATPASLSLTPRPTGQRPDHWLYRAQPELFVDEERSRSVPVMGSLIEIRIGHAGQIISVTSQWRSLNGEELVVGSTVVADDGHTENGDHDHADENGDDENGHPSAAASAGGQGGADSPDYTYVLEGAGLPQHYLAPYVHIMDHHGQAVRSACGFALIVAFSREQRDRGMVITAVVAGGTGDYAFAWAFYKLDGTKGGLRTLKSSERIIEVESGRQRVSSVSIDNDAVVLMVNVKDRKTGAFKHYQQQVFSHPLAAPVLEKRGPELTS